MYCWRTLARPTASTAVPRASSVRQRLALAGPHTHLTRSYNLRSTVSSLDSQTNSVVRMTLLGVFA